MGIGETLSASSGSWVVHLVISGNLTTGCLSAAGAGGTADVFVSIGKEYRVRVRTLSECVRGQK